MRSIIARIKVVILFNWVAVKWRGEEVLRSGSLVAVLARLIYVRTIGGGRFCCREGITILMEPYCLFNSSPIINLGSVLLKEGEKVG